MRFIVALFALLMLSSVWAQPSQPGGMPAPIGASVDASASGSPAIATASSGALPIAVPAASDKAMAYYWSSIGYAGLDFLLALAFPAALLFSGFSARMRNLATRVGRRWFFIVALYFIFYVTLSFIVALPLTYLRGFVHEHAYGLSQQALSGWFGDQLKGLAVTAVIGALCVWLPFLLLAKSPKRWWLYTGAAAVPFMCLMLLVQPVWIAPLFNKFEPMRNTALEKNILALADHAGIEGGRVFEVDMSTKTSKVNAYVSGIGSSKRIVLWDTLMAKLDQPEILFVMGHEIGHYVLGHIWKTILFFSGMVFVLLYGVHRIGNVLLARYHARFGIDRS